MSGSNKANYARIGFFIVLTASLAVGVLMFLGGIGNGKHEFLCETYFTYPVSGLEVGSAVNFRGVKVGSVKRISFIANEYANHSDADAQNIWVQIALDTRLMGVSSEESIYVTLERMIAKGLHVKVSASGVTGLSKLEVDYPRTKIEDKPISWQPRTLCVPPAPSILQSASDSAQQILDQINHMDLLYFWTNAMGCISSANDLLANSASLVGAQQGAIGEIISNLRDASVNLRDFSQQIKDNPGALLRNREQEPLPETK